ncbi:DUF2065 domain-containing protein [Stappia sp. F7233]|uniref:DUF2065 domain-containing protein n=1 Tax=Stappia albiluteola TaxID=2758565 RepID=A0A839AGV5_9HYPH|nr:DUF2065 domain-containing protein [Stappia albiluteola]MBA5777769.1 DUF2065 domain-containing protein [Stappia albiluteola]
MSDFAVAVGLVLVIEGLFYALVPGAVKNFMRQAVLLPDQIMRMGGLAALFVGVFVVWLIRG